MDIKDIIEDAKASGADLIDVGERLDELYQGERTLYPHYLFSEKELTKLVELTLKRASLSANELQAKLSQAEDEKAELVKHVREVIRISDRKHDAWDKVKELINYD